MLKSKKGQLGNIQGIILTLVVAAIVLGVGLTVLDSFSGALTAGSQAQLATANTTVALGDFGDTWFTIIVTVSASVIILGLILRAFR